MNHWHVYEYMKHVYMRTGQVIDETELEQAFPELTISDIREGIEEFNLVFRKDAVC